MKKNYLFILLGIFGLFSVVLAGCTSQTTDQVHDILYENSGYGFTLKFPKTWENYKVHNRMLTWGGLGTSDSIDFGFPGQDSVFNVSIHTHEQWKQIQATEGPKPVFLGENEQYIFGYTMAQTAVDDFVEERLDEVRSIVGTFKVK